MNPDVTGAGAAGEFHTLYTGRLWSVMSWDQLTAFWGSIDPAAGWYLVATGTPPLPDQPADAATVTAFITRIDALLREEHHESYCGIVYTDHLEQPRLIKIYDPNHLGSSCGSSKHPTPPGWVMSRMIPDQATLEVSARPPTVSRQRWWQGLFSGH